MRSVKFSDLISVPHRERAIRKRANPPSYNLTSEQHIEYITSKNSSSKQPAKQASKYPGDKQPKKRSTTHCNVCKAHYGDPNDLKATEEWVKCGPSSAWFHESCGEENGSTTAMVFSTAPPTKSSKNVNMSRTQLHASSLVPAPENTSHLSSVNSIGFQLNTESTTKSYSSPTRPSTA
ncbi:unnamed protein product [Boreogadus saida]